jgi:hypothetical protein
MAEKMILIPYTRYIRLMKSANESGGSQNHKVLEGINTFGRGSQQIGDKQAFNTPPPGEPVVNKHTHKSNNDIDQEVRRGDQDWRTLWETL